MTARLPDATGVPHGGDPGGKAISDSCDGMGLMSERGLQIHEWDQQGYRPLVFHHDWMVALLNWEPAFEPTRLGEVERHVHTDEVFVLTRGRALLFTEDEEGLQIADMRPGVIYNVLQGVWHGLLATRDACWVIVESRDTHLHDVEFRQLSADEREHILGQLPAWARPHAP
jgi:mannose-6-phosphate isomerase-like protein (cupin superfamily)